jgi:putative PIN family toxin of toxin-antitoxin system
VRIVLDTNVVMSALLWRGATYRLLEALRQQPRVQIYSSATLLEELADILTRPSATKRLAIIDRTVHQVLTDYLAIIELVEPISVPRIVPNDPDDDHVLALATAANAELIVSGDEDLLSLNRYQGIDIVTPAEALQRIAAG